MAVLITVALAAISSRYWYQLMLIQGDSMAPTYHNLQLVVLDRHSRARAPGDVIAFRCEGLRSVLVKRVVACPGDEAQIAGGALLVNGEPSLVYPGEERFAFAGLLAEPVALGPGEYLVIGDNIARSRDSRYAEVGVVREETILGKIVRSNRTGLSPDMGGAG